MEIRDAIAELCARRDLSTEEMADTMGRIMDGNATPGQIAALLVGLRLKGETVDEVVGAARAMRARATCVRVPDGILVDTCGTGGDGARTVNISTIAALVVAACGVRVAKHGNRSVSSRSGSADVLEALGVDVSAPPRTVERCLHDIGIGFFFAPAYHGATQKVAAVRREIGVRTIFNLLGPLTNPAGVQYQLVGVYDPRWVEPIARALGHLGAARVLVLHGAGGLDEFAPAGETRVAELIAKQAPGAGVPAGGEPQVTSYRLTPRDFGLDESDPAELAGGDAHHNAGIVRSILGGAHSAVRNVVIMSAAATLRLAGAAPDLQAGARRAAAALDDGSALGMLERLADASRERRPGEAEAAA
jgi:anthranilate phosphoribosyltransferase